MKFRIVIIPLLFVGVCFGDILKASPHIVGGDEAQLHAYPYQVGLKIFQLSSPLKFCGGSLLSDEWIVTAAHCLYDVKSITAILGAHRIHENGPTVQNIPVEKIIVHPEWNVTYLANDVALLKLSHPANIITNITEPVRLPGKSQQSNAFVDTPVEISGWGRDSDSSLTMSDVLRSVRTRVVRNPYCTAHFSSFKIIKSHICASGWDGKGACHGDSGGPMVFQEDDGQRTLIGVTSFVAGQGCELLYPSVFTRVTSYLDWIHTTTGIALRP